jgi:ABC-2 type transport system ATP-binding protein
MDEAERCHRISYISYGKMLASGTVAEVVRDAGLTTFIVRGPHLDRIEEALAGKPGIDQVAPFGVTLHVVGADGAAMEKTLGSLKNEQDITIEPGETSLEDVFIQFMGKAKDNMG